MKLTEMIRPVRHRSISWRVILYSLSFCIIWFVFYFITLARSPILKSSKFSQQFRPRGLGQFVALNKSSLDTMIVDPNEGHYQPVSANAELLNMLYSWGLKKRPPIPSYSNMGNKNRQLPESNCWKQVQIWSHEGFKSGKHACPGLSCGIRLVVDTSTNTLQRSDAVLLMHRTNWNWANMLARKPTGQKWIFFSHESPVNTKRDIIPPAEHFNESYDYLMSYRFRESLLYGSFGRFEVGTGTVPQNDTRNWAEGRTRQVAWLSSNCYSTFLKWDRTGYVRELSKLVDVGMFGKCGNESACPDSLHDSRTCGKIFKQFKFYLALENSACRDYISEKFWKNAFYHDLVPIVFGPPRSDYEAVAPPHSFIHVQDFKNIRDLAEYIQVLDKNDHLYNKYFEWKKLGRVRWTLEKWLFAPQQMCQVVERLLADEQRVKEGSVVKPLQLDLKSWWTDSCADSYDYPVKKN